MDRLANAAPGNDERPGPRAARPRKVLIARYNARMENGFPGKPNPASIIVMSLAELIDFPATGALLGVDPGARRIGVAVCDPRRSIATALGTIHRSKLAQDLAQLFSFYDTRNCAGLVIGLPLNMDGSEGPRAQSARAFARNILKSRDIPVALHDERLSSAAADAAMEEAQIKWRQRRDRRDETAAAIILQSAIDALGGMR